MKTIEDYFRGYKNLYQFEEGSPEYLVDEENFKAALFEFAKFHVTAALEAASKEDLNCECDSWERCHNKMPVNDILNSYPLTNIK